MGVAVRDHRHFNSLPHAEVDADTFARNRCLYYFNSLPHAEVDQWNSSCLHDAFKFQLTTSRRGRPAVHMQYRLLLYFNSLPHAEVDGKEASFFISIIFQLTTSRRGRRLSCQSVANMEYFNSLPHAEVDGVSRALKNPLYISTHYLTQR